MTQGILHQIGIRDKFKACAKHNLLANVIYKIIRNDVVKQIANAKSNYTKQRILENKDNIKNLWKLLKEIAPIKPVAHIPACIKVNNDYITDFCFSGSITNIPTDLATTQSDLNTLLDNFVKAKHQTFQVKTISLFLL